MEALSQYKKHIVRKDASAREALQLLDYLGEAESKTLFVLEDNKLIGTLTDGDIRRGLLRGLEISASVLDFMNKNFKSLLKEEVRPDVLSGYRENEIWLLPVVNEGKEIQQIIDLKNVRTVIPATAVIIAGGRGERLRPLTDAVPKPMLKVGKKPIIEINIDRLINFGIRQFYISVGYLAEKIIDYLGDGSSKGVQIRYLHDVPGTPLGTLGACSMIEQVDHDQLLIMNSDILTNINFEDFYDYYTSNKAVMCAASIPYKVQLPYGIMQADEGSNIMGLTEKPMYTYYANAGIYLVHKNLLPLVPKGRIYNATDLMQHLIDTDQKLVHYPILQYWLDIGKYEDYIRAQEDIKHISYS